MLYIQNIMRPNIKQREPMKPPNKNSWLLKMKKNYFKALLH